VYWKPAFLPSMEQIEQAVVLEPRREMVAIGTYIVTEGKVA